MTPRLLILVDAPANVTEVTYGVVCKNARFVFDCPVTILKGECLELKDGRFFLVSQANGLEWAIPLEGKWDR